MADFLFPLSALAYAAFSIIQGVYVFTAGFCYCKTSFYQYNNYILYYNNFFSISLYHIFSI